MRILALDFGSANTGVAVCDPSGTVVRPLEAIGKAASEKGRGIIKEMVARENIGLVLVGLPVTLAGETGKQAQETEDFISALRSDLEVPVETWDERFTTKIAAEKGRHSKSNSHSIAACCLLEDYLGSREYRNRLTYNQGDGSEDE
jgi:putative Holliday junction resolvase